MKKLIALVLTLAAMTAEAASIKIHEEYVWGGNPTVSGTFGINEELGRAWVELDVSKSNDVDAMPDSHRIKVEGLSLVGGSVVLNVEGQEIECAKIRPVGIFRYRMAKNTGKCVFKSKVEKRQVDDGFEIRKFKVMTVTLETK